MWLPNMNWLGVLGKKLAKVKNWVSVKVNFGGGCYLWGGGSWEGLCEIFLRKINSGYVVGKNELARCVG